MKDAIQQIYAYQVLDSRGLPTVACRVTTKSGASGVAQVPSGTSTGKHEAVELRDNNPKHFRGQGVDRAIRNVNKILAKKVVGLDVADQKKIDAILLRSDPTSNKSKIGANALLAVSLASIHAAANSANTPLYKHLRPKKKYELPLPLFNVINGGAHANNGLSVQEFKLVPLSAKNMHEACEIGSNIFQTMKAKLARHGESTGVGAEGGFAPRLQNSEAALQLIISSIKSAGYRPGDDVAIALDVAASEFYKKGTYVFDTAKLTAKALSELYSVWIGKYLIVSIEDPFAQDDWNAWTQFTERHAGHLQIIGDDLLVTNPRRVEHAIERRAVNAVLIKPNQIGTLAETLQVIHMAHEAKLQCVMSHRSGETTDTTISDLAVAFSCSQIKAGSLSRSERLEKYNRLMKIEDELGSRATLSNPKK
jgi:enolase